MKDKLKNNRQLTIGNWQYYLLLTVNCLLSTIFFSCNNEKEKSGQITDTTEVYYCPMCPGQEQHEQGICKICDMDLEVKPDSATAQSQDITVKPVNESVLSNIKTIKPQVKEVPVFANAIGYITYDPGRVNDIAARIGGRIEELYVRYLYQPVQKGDPLFEIFSHELLSAQNEYLFIKSSSPDSSFLKAAKKKLLLLGMKESQINNLKNGHIHPNTTVYSSYTGFVIEKNEAEMNKDADNAIDAGMPGQMAGTNAMPEKTNEKQLIIREGAYVKTGETVFKVANTDVVWAIFEVYPNNIGLIKKNLPLQIKIENSDKEISGKIDFIEPFYNQGEKTLRFRVYLQNKNQLLKIGNLLSGRINGGTKKGIWIPQSALIDLGRERVVFIKKDGAFETRKVLTGEEFENMVEVISGLSTGEEIAETAQYLIDSESFIRVRE